MHGLAEQLHSSMALSVITILSVNDLSIYFCTSTSAAVSCIAFKWWSCCWSWQNTRTSNVRFFPMLLAIIGCHGKQPNKWILCNRTQPQCWKQKRKHPCLLIMLFIFWFRVPLREFPRREQKKCQNSGDGRRCSNPSNKPWLCFPFVTTYTIKSMHFNGWLCNSPLLLHVHVLLLMLSHLWAHSNEHEAYLPPSFSSDCNFTSSSGTMCCLLYCKDEKCESNHSKNTKDRSGSTN